MPKKRADVIFGGPSDGGTEECIIHVYDKSDAPLGPDKDARLVLEGAFNGGRRFVVAHLGEPMPAPQAAQNKRSGWLSRLFQRKPMRSCIYAIVFAQPDLERYAAFLPVLRSISQDSGLGIVRISQGSVLVLRGSERGYEKLAAAHNNGALAKILKSSIKSLHRNYDVFVSYTAADANWVAEALVPRLEAAGLLVIFDERDFAFGQTRLANIEEAVKNSNHTLLILSEDWLHDSFKQFESVLSADADPNSALRKVIPLLLRPCDDLPPWLRAIHSANFLDPASHEAAFSHLVRQLLRSAHPSSPTQGEEEGETK